MIWGWCRITPNTEPVGSGRVASTKHIPSPAICCYGDPKILLKVDASLKKIERFEFDCSLGIMPIGGGKFLVGRGTSSKEKGHTGSLVVAEADKERGLKVVLEATPKK